MGAEPAADYDSILDAISTGDFDGTLVDDTGLPGHTKTPIGSIRSPSAEGGLGAAKTLLK